MIFKSVDVAAVCRYPGIFLSDLAASDVFFRLDVEGCPV